MRCAGEVGMVFQSFNLFPHYTIVKNLMLAQQLVRKISKTEAHETAMHYLTRVKIPETGRQISDRTVGRSTATGRNRAGTLHEARNTAV